MIILGIDPGSVTTGWALIEINGNKTKYLNSGILKFDGKMQFLDRLTEIQNSFSKLVDSLDFDQVAIESLIYAKSPTALIKLAQTRGVMLSCLVNKYHGKIFEYSPNLVKSTAVGHGHATKESVSKFLDLALGAREYATHDESDAVAIALCHVFNKDRPRSTVTKSSKSRSLKGSLAHKAKTI